MARGSALGDVVGRAGRNASGNPGHSDDKVQMDMPNSQAKRGWDGSGCPLSTGGVSATTLGPPNAADVFVTAASDIRGLNVAGIAERLTIPKADSFRVFEFPSSEVSGIASPINRVNPGFIGGGRTAGGAREFVIPNGPIPPGTMIRVVR